MARTPKQIHFVSRIKDRSQRGWTDNGDGTFSTEAWAVSSAAAHSVDKLYLHNKKSDTAWDGGTVTARDTVPVATGRPQRWRFTVRRDLTQGMDWPGGKGGGPEKAYV
jgi:hypothetical protein